MGVKHQSGGTFGDITAAKALINGSWVEKPVKYQKNGAWVEAFPSEAANYIFTNEDELNATQSRVNNGTAPFSTAHDNLVSDADTAKGSALQSVTDDTSGDHRFIADGNHGRHDYLTAVEEGDRARDCAMAYWFTGDDTYANDAIDRIHHWCLNDSTYMKPTVNEVGNGISIEQNITIPKFMYAASFLRGHSRWGNYDGSRPWDGGDSGDAESAFQQWVSDRRDTFEGNIAGFHQYNNQWAWWTVDFGVSSAYLEDDSGVSRMKDLYKAQDIWTDWDWDNDGVVEDGQDRPWTDYRDVTSTEGYFNHERGRDRGFHYTGYNLRALAQVCVIAEKWDGSDLWSFNAPTDPDGGSTLKKAFEWFAPYITDVSTWQWDSNPPPDTTTREEAVCGYELAHTHWDAYDSQIDNPDGISGRPHHDIRILGHVTLTNGVP